VDIFHFFEKKGMMKNFRKKFKEWKEVFLKRIRQWLLPLIKKGKTLYEILMNKLSTKKTLKGVELKVLKGVGIKSKESFYKSIYGNRNNTDDPPFPEVQEMHDVGDLLRNRLQIREGDVYMFTKSFSLNHLKRAIMMKIEWLRRGMEVISPAKVLQTCLNRTKNHYGH
jgi:hypothetical protein